VSETVAIPLKDSKWVWVQTCIHLHLCYTILQG